MTSRRAVERARRQDRRSGHRAARTAPDLVRLQPGTDGHRYGFLCELCPLDAAQITVAQSAPTLGELIDAAARHWANCHENEGG